MMREVHGRDIQGNVFQMIEEAWFLLAAEKENGAVNCMTAQWGAMGHLWGDNVCVVFVRPQRYTHEFITESDSFSLSFFGEEFRPMLRYMGTVSGRDEAKIDKQNLKLAHLDGIPYFPEAKIVLTCEKVYTGKIEKDGFNDTALLNKVYPQEDYHTMIIGRVKKVLVD